MDKFRLTWGDRVAHFRCPLCGKARPIRLDKNGKPYIICNDCMLQLFIRGDSGIELLKQRKEYL